MGVLFTSLSGQVPDYYQQKTEAEAKLGRKLTNAEFEAEYLDIGEGSGLSQSGTSVFDPCLCELDYCWYTKKGDDILDPFAGGSVRGVVAHVLARNYTGIELRAEQVEANVDQGRAICPGNEPEWIIGDSSNVDEIVGDRMFDHIFTCPPYGSLEVYSDDPADISNREPDQFDREYAEIVRRCAGHLKDDRFATVVIGNYRDKRGSMRDLVGVTVRAMESAGLKYYNDAILETSAGSLPIRVGKQFESSRKLGKRHQYVLTFVKGDPKKATARIGNVELAGFNTGENERREIVFTKADADILEWFDLNPDSNEIVKRIVRRYLELKG